MAGPRRDGVAGRNRTFRHRLAFDLIAAGALDRTGNPCPHPEMVVGCVADRVDRERGDIAFDDLELQHARKASSGVSGLLLAKEASLRAAGQYAGYGQGPRAKHPAASGASLRGRRLRRPGAEGDQERPER